MFEELTFVFSGEMMVMRMVVITLNIFLDKYSLISPFA